MCGLFGTIRPQEYPQELRSIAATALIDLGYLAEERGVDSAGIATLHSRALSPCHTQAPPCGNTRLAGGVSAPRSERSAPISQDTTSCATTSAQHAWSWATPGGPPRVPPPSTTPPR